jgi:aryl sulfotransferase
MRPPEAAVMRSATRCAPVPRPGKLRGHVVTMRTTCLSCAMAGAASAPAAAPTPAALMKLRRSTVRCAAMVALSGEPNAVDAQISMKSPWIDIAIRDLAEVMARLEAQSHRRQVKTHTPFDGIPLWPDLRYIAVYRHPLDVFLSWQRHVANMTRDIHKERAADPDAAFTYFLEGDHHEGVSLGGLVEHYRCTLDREPRENLLRLHYADMLADLPSAVAAIAAHVGIDHPPALMERIVKAATFDSMKANAARFAPSAGQGFWHSDAGFFDSAGSGKWSGRFNDAQLAAYDARMATLLDTEARRWLEQGSDAG